MSNPELTRRHTLALMAGTAGTALAGCISAPSEETGEAAEETAYIVNYHWNFAVFDEDGTELDVLEVTPNTEVTLYAVNDHAYDAIDELPEPVAAAIHEMEPLERVKAAVEAGEVPEPEDATVEEVYEEAHGLDHDDGHGDDHDDDGDDDGHHDDDHDDHDDDGDDDGHHDDDHDDHHDDGDDDGHHDDDDHDHGNGHEGGKLDHGFMILGLDVTVDVPADANEPTEATFMVEEPGTYEAICTVDCGYYHAKMVDELLRVET